MSGALEGLAAIVTGGGSGIGAAITACLRSEGARVSVLDRDISGLATDAYQADVSERSSVDRAVTAAASQMGGLDLLVNNAGIGSQGDITANQDEEWARVFSVNVTGLARVTSAALPYLHQSRAAAICNIASVAATVGLPQRALYSASKGAVLSLTRAMAVDHLADGIRVNAVCPGTVATPWVERLLASAPDPGAELVALEARQPHKRLVSAEEVAASVAYLLSPAAGSTTGTYIEVDGGMAALRPRK